MAPETTRLLPQWVEEAEFAARLAQHLSQIETRPDFVTGPGRSGAVAAVYASYALGCPFAPYGAPLPAGSHVLIVDTVSMSGRTIRKAVSKYERRGHPAQGLIAFDGDQRHHFWFERLAGIRD